MENYRKGCNVEEPVEKLKIPIPDLPADFLWMQVRGGSKIRNLLEYALQNFPNTKTVVWTGFGPSVGKTITCAEIMKREHKQKLHQITKLGYRMVNEYWDPIIPDLDQLVIKRKLPLIHICLSAEKLSDKDELGYQAPGEIIPFKGQNSGQPSRRQPNRNYHKSSQHNRNQNSNRSNKV